MSASGQEIYKKIQRFPPFPQNFYIFSPIFPNINS